MKKTLLTRSLPCGATQKTVTLNLLTVLRKRRTKKVCKSLGKSAKEKAAERKNNTGEQDS